MLRRHRKILPRKRRFGCANSDSAQDHLLPHHNHLLSLDRSASPVLLLVAFQHQELAEPLDDQAKSAQPVQWVNPLVVRA
jgi:hypothetical protein